MLEKPEIQDEQIAACLYDEYGLNTSAIIFLPLGADMNTAVYRAVGRDGLHYFVKLRRGAFDTVSVDVPKFLHDQGVREIIAPIANQSGQLSSPLGEFNLILSPFVEGYGGWDVDLSDCDWVHFGRALKSIHSAALPPSLAARIPCETYSPYWRERVTGFQEQIQADVFVDPSAAALASLLKDKQRVVDHLIQRAEDLGAALQLQTPAEVLCHSDIHVGNVLMSSDDDGKLRTSPPSLLSVYSEGEQRPEILRRKIDSLAASDNALYIVDWDQPILAPKERDLMFIGGGLGGGGHTPEQEESLFYEGYGQTEINPVALAYYRYERIIQDIAAYCQQLLLTDEGGEDRAEGLRQLTSQFLPGAVIDMAYRSEQQLPPNLQSYLHQ